MPKKWCHYKPDTFVYECAGQNKQGMVHNRRNCVRAGNNTSKDNVQKRQLCGFKIRSEELSCILETKLAV